MAKSNDFTFEVINVIGVLSESKKGWKKELTRVSWNGSAPKYDLRDWDAEHTKMGKGVTLTEEELRQLHQYLSQEIEILDQK